MMIGVATCPVKKQEEDDDDEGYRIFENQELNSFGVGVDDGYLWINGKRTEQIPSFVKFIEGNSGELFLDNVQGKLWFNKNGIPNGEPIKHDSLKNDI